MFAVTILIILVSTEIASIPYVYLFHSFKTFPKAAVTFLLLNLSVGFIWSGLQIYGEMSGNYYLAFMNYFTYNSIPLFPTASLTYMTSFFVRKAVWKYNWNLKSDTERNLYCIKHFNPCCENVTSIACMEHMSYSNLLSSYVYIMIFFTVIFSISGIIHDTYFMKKVRGCIKNVIYKLLKTEDKLPYNIVLLTRSRPKKYKKIRYFNFELNFSEIEALKTAVPLLEGKK